MSAILLIHNGCEECRRHSRLLRTIGHSVTEFTSVSQWTIHYAAQGGYLQNAVSGIPLESVDAILFLSMPLIPEAWGLSARETQFAYSEYHAVLMDSLDYYRRKVMNFHLQGPLAAIDSRRMDKIAFCEQSGVKYVTQFSEQSGQALRGVAVLSQDFIHLQPPCLHFSLSRRLTEAVIATRKQLAGYSGAWICFDFSISEGEVLIHDVSCLPSPRVSDDFLQSSFWPGVIALHETSGGAIES